MDCQLVSTPGDVKDPKLSLHGITQLAQYCPNLRELELSVPIRFAMRESASLFPVLNKSEYPQLSPTTLTISSFVTSGLKGVKTSNVSMQYVVHLQQGVFALRVVDCSLSRPHK